MGNTEPIQNTEEELFKRIGKNVRKYRKQKGFTIRQLSYASGLGTTTIHEIEHGLINTHIGTLFKVSNTLDIGFGQLFEEL